MKSCFISLEFRSTKTKMAFRSLAASAVAAGMMAGTANAQAQVITAIGGVPLPVHFVQVRSGPMHMPASAAARSECPVAVALGNVKDSCSAEINMCREATAAHEAAQERDRRMEDPLEALFGFPSSSSLPSDPFGPLRAGPFRSMAGPGPFFDPFHDFDQMMDDMLQSALQFGIRAQEQQQESQQPMIRMIVQEEEEEEESPAQEESSETEAPTCANVLAEAALQKMVNSVLERAVSVSASEGSAKSRRSRLTENSAASMDEDEDEAEDEEEPAVAPRAGEVGGRDRVVLSHDEPDLVADVDDSFVDHPPLDPVLLAKWIVQHGRAILKNNDVPQEQGRRRLQAINPEEQDILRHLALRLTEVVSPFAGMPDRVLIQPLDLGPGGDNRGTVRVMVRQNPMPMQRPTALRRLPSPADHPASTPKLMLGSTVDECLWDAYDGDSHPISSQCASSLDDVRTLHSKIVEEEMQRKKEQRAVLEAILFGSNDENGNDKEGAVVDTDIVGSNHLFWIWAVFFVASIYSCCVADNDENDDDECLPLEEQEYGASDYVLIGTESFSGENRKPKEAEAAVYTGIPVV